MSCDNRLWRITVDTNPEDCNYHCIMCEEHSCYSHFKQQLGRHRRMPIEWLDKIFEQASELGIREIIPSTMGEPLLYNGIDRFYLLAKQYGIKVNLTTNGSFPCKSIQEWAEIIIPNTTDVKISINGATAATSEAIMVGSHFDKTIANIKELVAYRNAYYKEHQYYCRITLQLTFMQNNMHELADVVKMAAELDVDRIKGHHLWTHFPEIEPLSMKQNAESIAQWNEYVSQAKFAQQIYRKPNGQMVLLENIETIDNQLGKLIDETAECPFLNRELWIAAEGKISPCCAPDALRQTLGDFGNIQTVKLQDSISSPNYRQLVENYKKVELCRTCNMRR